MAEDTKAQAADDQAQADQAAQVEIAQRRRKDAPATEVPDDAEPDETTSDRAPRVWLAYNPKSGRRFNHVPTQGSGVNGELTPDEVQAYFPTRAQYDEATKSDPPLYLRARKVALRPTAPHEVTPHGES